MVTKILSIIFKKSFAYLVVALVFLNMQVGGTVSALSQSDLHSIYNDSVWYKLGGASGDDFACGGAGDLDSFLKALAYLESGGNPTAENSWSGASGKYQYLTETWQSTTMTYYPPATQYPRALNAPESYQDATTYILFALRSKQTDGDIFKMAVAHYLPAANQDPSLLDIVPPGNVLTPRQYANHVIQNMSNAKAQAIPLKYSEAPSFESHLAKVGSPEIASPLCSCSSAIVATAKLYSWPTYTANYTVMKPEYKAAIEAAQARGEYVGLPAGVDCGGFTTRVMRDSGADKEFNAQEGNTFYQKKYMDEHPELYENLGTMSSTDSLQPGDIAITANTHTYLFLGNEGFPNYDSASASQGDRAPMASSAYFVDSSGVAFTWYRLKCPVGGSS